jgi:hypothetical protein
MKVGELREVLQKYDRDTLSEIAVSLYKAIPKKIKEENDLDAVLADFNNKEVEKKKTDLAVDFESLQNEILQFVTYAEAQFYLAPNQYVRKKDRPKWRFLVKQYIKTLLGVTGENAAAAADLLNLLYRMLSYGCAYYIFNTENPFASVGYGQTELFSLVITKNLQYGVSKDVLRKIIGLALESNVNYETLYIQLFFALVNSLKTPDAKVLAAEECLDYVKDPQVSVFRADGFFRVKKDDYHQNALKEHATELYFHLKAALYEYDDAIQYYWKNNTSKNAWKNEVALYILLKWLEIHEQTELWLREYEKAVDRKTEPRKELTHKFEYLKSGKSFSSYYDYDDDDDDDKFEI